MIALSPSAARVQQALRDAGLDCTIVEHAVAARTSAEAALALGVSVGEIAKSLIFRRASGDGVLVIASGANRVDEAKIAALLGEPIGKADAAFVRDVTGYAIGGIPPLAHAHRSTTLVDRDLLRFATVHAAGGTPNAMFPIRPQDLVAISQGRVADVRKEPA
mgnify:FL=1